MAECGGCTACCKLMGVAELQKPRDVWCRHCAIGSGCTVYAARPRGCRDFNCLWLQSQDHPGEAASPELRPDRSRVVMSCTEDGEGLVLYVDPDRPAAFRHRRVAAIIDRFLDRDGKVYVLVGKRFFTFKDKRLVEVA